MLFRCMTQSALQLLPHLHPFIHTFIHQRWCQPCQAAASSSGAGMVRGHLNTELGGAGDGMALSASPEPVMPFSVVVTFSALETFIDFLVFSSLHVCLRSPQWFCFPFWFRWFLAYRIANSPAWLTTRILTLACRLSALPVVEPLLIQLPCLLTNPCLPDHCQTMACYPDYKGIIPCGVSCIWIQPFWSVIFQIGSTFRHVITY